VAQNVDIEEKGRGPTTDRQWLIKKQTQASVTAERDAKEKERRAIELMQQRQVRQKWTKPDLNAYEEPIIEPETNQRRQSSLDREGLQHETTFDRPQRENFEHIIIPHRDSGSVENQSPRRRASEEREKPRRERSTETEHRRRRSIDAEHRRQGRSPEQAIILSEQGAEQEGERRRRPRSVDKATQSSHKIATSPERRASRTQGQERGRKERRSSRDRGTLTERKVSGVQHRDHPPDRRRESSRDVVRGRWKSREPSADMDEDFSPAMDLQLSDTSE